MLINAYYLTNSVLSAAALARTKIQLSLSEAEQLVSDCKVSVLSLNYGGGSEVSLREMAPMLPGAQAQYERRVLNPNDFPQILALARKKEVQDKCGYIPTYDIRQARMQPTTEWITVDKAKALMCTHSWLVELWPDRRYFTPAPMLPSPPITDILLSSKPSVWNDGVHKDIILMPGASEDAKNTLTALNKDPAACK